jgi:hypothetical protein
MTKRSGHFQTDKPGADDHSSGGPVESTDDSAAVLERSQVVNVGQIGAFDGEASWFGTWSEEKSSVLVMAAVVEFDPAPRRVDTDNLAIDYEINVMLLVEVAAAEGHPFLGGCAGQVVLGQVGSVNWSFLADQRDRIGVSKPSESLCGGSTTAGNSTGPVT